MDYQSAVTYLDAHIGAGMQPGLDRIRGLLDLMGNPEQSCPIVHVAGTNGKTSTTRILASILSAHDLTAGYFISPHLQRVEERIGVGRRHATPAEFAQAVTDVAAFADIHEARGKGSLTYFELTAAMAFAWFAEIAANVAVVEVGMGGRLDATNAANAAVAVVTSIGMDHTEFLGDTLEKITLEKLGIVREGAKLVTGPLPEAALAVVARVVAERNVSHYSFNRDFRVEGTSPAVGGWFCQIGGLEAEYDDLFLPLLGRHQTNNLAVAIAAAEALRGKRLDIDALLAGTAAVRSPGRMEPIGSQPLVVLDGAHNPQGFEAMSRALAESFDTPRWVLLMGAMRDKDVREMLTHLRGRVAAAVTTSTGAARAMPPSELSSAIAETLEIEAVPVVDPAEALALAREKAGIQGGVIVTGSIYLVGLVRSLLLGENEPQRNER